MTPTSRRAGAALAAIAALAAGACSTPPAAPSSTMDRIRDEMRQAARADAARPEARPDAVERALLPPLQIEMPRPAPAAEPRFDLAVSNAPAAQVFLSIASGSRYSILVPPEVTGAVSANLKNVTVREALDALRDLYGYEYRMQGTRITIQPNTVQTRIFQVNYLASKRQGSSEMRVTSSSITNSAGNGNANPIATTATTTQPAGAVTTSGPPSSRVSTENNSEFWSELRETLVSIVGSDGNRRVIVNAHSGVIAIRALPSEIRNAETYLRMTQLIIERQVMIEAKIIEVQLSEGFSSGVNWAAFRGSRGRLSAGPVAPGTVLAPTGPIGTGATGIDPVTGALTDPLLSATAGVNLLSSAANLGSMFGLAFQSSDFAALLQFLETQGNVQVLSSPRIATINNQKAVLKVGTDEFFVTSVSTSTTSSANNNVTSPTINVQPFFSGIALDVTPQIGEGDAIILHLHPSVSVVAEKQKNVDLGSLGNFRLPLAASTVNESDSVVRVRDGHIVAIGGLMKQRESADSSGLPGTTGSSVFGSLFGQRARSSTKSELVMLLKPTIIRGEGDWEKDAADLQRRLQSLEPVAAASAQRDAALR
ncbi:MAG TPA: secretin N-terminal domain-containing protein [Caldimonas sp.]|jgi:MSHA biogenesis protein MshL|nr:secretin N-terminal domain-containing protein [Caldimonas sp.]HEV7577375.1 secretin N-terminal domain-containing protein [Caldimonas sp.]